MSDEQEYKTQLGKAIRNKRTELGATIEKVAGIADIHTRTLQRIEHGETSPQVTTLVKIAIALDLSSTAELLKDADKTVYPLFKKAYEEE
ncbi:helix-turn-helix domain-containing protein [Bacillus suaedae]|uniref:Helix-turn-helix transcriptional regulator n=1 Tax=Halalkalibacter suaedae TaxID=2822140 RepID=A0A941ARR9_9BACI|nr:helix-turn-helix transcriptional regulator [Bacillus suaedae]MBP3953143.1 helix-turn-helix transcriptional regulator [Bacillus suaedae]